MGLVCSSAKTARRYWQAPFWGVLLWSIHAWVTGPVFPLFCPGLKNENADAWTLLSDNRALVGRWGERRKERWEEGEAEGVQNVRTRSLGDHSPGSPSVWQLWKFIAIDFVISSLSIGSTWAHWRIARKLFLQSCCFLFYILVSPLLQCL